MDIGLFLSNLAGAGVFDYVLPFLLVFALVFGILSKTQLFGNESKGINAVIALALGALSLQLDIIPLIFRELFPRLGVGIAVLLGLFILVGLFIPGDAANQTRKTWDIILSVVGAIIFLIIVFQTFNFFGWGGFSSGYWGGDIVGWIVGLIVFVGIIVAVIWTSR